MTVKRDENGRLLPGSKLGTGRPAESMGRKNVKKIVNNEIDRIAKMVFGMSLLELQDELKKKGELTAAAQLLINQIIKQKNLKALELLMDRVLGRCAQQVQVDHSNNEGVTFKLVKESENRKDDQAS